MTVTTDGPRAGVRGGRSSTPTGSRRSVGDWVALVLFVVGSQAAGLIGTLFTDPATSAWYDQLETPPFNPPSWVFGPVWTVLYVLIGVAAWLVWRADAVRERTVALALWVVQLALNAAWTPIFFGAQRPGWALVELVVTWVAVVATAGACFRVRSRAGWVFTPYVVWVTFALVLNASIAVLNA
jgi:translocator protein